MELSNYFKCILISNVSVSFSSLIAWAKTNVGMLMEISDSLLIVLKANVNLLFTVLSTLISVVLGSGQAMLKFLFNTVRRKRRYSIITHNYQFLSDHFLHYALLLTPIKQRTLCTNCNEY